MFLAGRAIWLDAFMHYPNWDKIQNQLESNAKDYLDEIGEMNIDLQAKLLRFLQTGQYQRVGSNSMETVNVRIVCATNRDPL